MYKEKDLKKKKGRHLLKTTILVHGIVGSVTSRTGTIVDGVRSVVGSIVGTVSGGLAGIISAVDRILSTIDRSTTSVVRTVISSVGRRGVVRGRWVHVIVGAGRVVVHRCCGGRISCRARSSGCGKVGGASLDHNRLNLLGHNCACGSMVIVGRVLIVHGRVLVTFLAPAPGQQTRNCQGCQATDNNTGNGATREPTGLLLHGYRAICGSDNRGRGGGTNSAGGSRCADKATGGAANDAGCARDPGGGASNKGGAAHDSGSADPAGGAIHNSGSAAIVGCASPHLDAAVSFTVARSGGGDKGGGALAGAVLEGVTIGIGQASDTAASEKTLDVGRVLCC